MSDIKPTSYTPEAVRALFTAFQAQASSSLLFLKNVCRVALFTRSADHPQPQLVYRASVDAAQVGSPHQTMLAGTAASAGSRDCTLTSWGPAAYTLHVQTSQLLWLMRDVTEQDFPCP